MKRKLGILLAATMALAVQAQSAGTIGGRPTSRTWSREVRVGENVGGILPLPLPREIRAIHSYNPTFSPTVSVAVTRWWSSRWGTSVALKLENRGMTTEAAVKNYGMEICGDGKEHTAGYWTGRVFTRVRNSYLSVPLQVVCPLSQRWRVSGGPYFSYLLQGLFSGHVEEGYLREGDPTGPKVVFEAGKTAVYDFSSSLQSFQWGLQLGTAWAATPQWQLFADASWGMNNAFEPHFHTITFPMHPLYVQVGIAREF